MPPDAEHARSLLNIARRDFRALQGMADDSETFDDAVFGFHAQQCCEKLLKSALSQSGRNYPFTHDLILLWKQLNEVIPLPSEFESLADLSPFAVQFRYESDWLSSYSIDRPDILERLSALRQWIIQELKIGE
jgi:HEPN domain-containing protein